MTPAEPPFRRSSWTVRPDPAHRRSLLSPARSRRASACASSWSGRPTRGSRSHCCRSFSPLSTRLAAAPSSACSPTTRRRVTRPKAPAGTSARSGSACSRRAACAGGAGSSRRRTSWASGRVRSRFSPPVASCALRRSERRRESRRRRLGLSRSRWASATSRESTAWPSGLPWPAMSGFRRPRSGASSPSGEGSWTSSRRPGESPCASSCSATRSNRSGLSPRSRSERCTG